MSDKKTIDLKEFVPRDGEVRAPYTSTDFDNDVDPARDDFNEGLDLPDINTVPMYVNIGPTHPATHGTFRVYALDGETVEKAVWTSATCTAVSRRSSRPTLRTSDPYTDRLNYCSALTSNVAYCKAMERMIGLDVPNARSRSASSSWKSSASWTT
jgi:NADH-quinone oxidoreductase subunit C/D